MPVYKKSPGSYYVRVSLKPDPATGNRREAKKGGFKTRKEAEAFEANWRVQIERGEYLPPSKQTVADYLKEWLESCKPSLSPTTYRRYTGIVNNQINAHIGKVKLQELQPYSIQQMYHALKLSPASVLYVHRVLHRALSQAVKWQLLYKNPAANVDAPRVRQQERSVLNTEQAWNIIELAPEHLRIPILIAVTTGMRRGEIMALRWTNLDLKAGVLRVLQAMRYCGKGEGFKPDHTKTDKSNRTVALSDGVIQALKDHRKQQTKNRMKVGPEYVNTGYVCTWPNGRPVSPDVVSRGFRKLATKLKYDVTFHDLRHSHATMLFEMGLNVKMVSDRLGHSTTRITQDTYQHVLPHMQEQVADVFDRGFFGGRKTDAHAEKTESSNGAE